MEAVDELKDEAKNNDDNKECEAGIHCQLAWEPTSLWEAVPICAHDAVERTSLQRLGSASEKAAPLIRPTFSSHPRASVVTFSFLKSREQPCTKNGRF